jgi:isoleucyl-tRNA synthetase
MLGNLHGFHPGKDLVANEGLEEIDRFILHRLQSLTGSVLESYKNWQFHMIVKDITGFCNTDLSAFYLDIVKDRLYCSGPTRERKSAQTVLYKILTNLLPLLAPILSFTAEEAYLTLAEEILKPCGVAAEKSVHLTNFPTIDPSCVDEGLARSWETLIAVRRDVLKQIEVLRTAKTIGHSLESAVTIYAEGELSSLLEEKRGDLAPLLVVSRVELARRELSPDGAYAGEKVDVVVEKSEAPKCARCWRFLESVGAIAEHPELCDRCASVVVSYYS